MKKRISVFLALVMGAMLLFGCAKPAAPVPETTAAPAAEATEAAATAEPAPTDEPAKEPTAYRVAALKGPTGMGVAYMMRDEQSPYSVEIFDAPDAVAAKFVSGEIDIAAVPVNLASVLYQKTAGDTVALALDTLGVLYIVENGETIRSFADLAGKKIYATGQGSTPEYILNYLLEKNGITDATVELVGEHAALAAMVASGEADVAMLPEPNVSSVMAKNGSVREALDLTEEWNRVSDTALVQGCYVMKRAAYEADPDGVSAFLTALAASVDAVNTNSDAGAVVADAGIVPSEAIAAAAIPRCNIVCITGQEMKSAMTGMLEVLFAANPASVGGALPGEDLYAE